MSNPTAFHHFPPLPTPPHLILPHHNPVLPVLQSTSSGTLDFVNFSKYVRNAVKNQEEALAAVAAANSSKPKRKSTPSKGKSNSKSKASPSPRSRRSPRL